MPMISQLRPHALQMLRTLPNGFSLWPTLDRLEYVYERFARVRDRKQQLAEDLETKKAVLLGLLQVNKQLLQEKERLVDRRMRQNAIRQAALARLDQQLDPEELDTLVRQQEKKEQLVKTRTLQRRPRRKEFKGKVEISTDFICMPSKHAVVFPTEQPPPVAQQQPGGQQT